MNNLRKGRGGSRARKPSAVTCRPKRSRAPVVTPRAASEASGKVYRGDARYAFLEGVAFGFARARAWV